VAAPTINFAGFVFDDAGDAVSGAVVHIYNKNATDTARESSSITTNSDGYWSYAHATPGEFDVEVVSGASTRRFKFDDKIHLAGIDVETLSIRGNEGALAAVYMYADEGDDASDQWRIDAGTDGVLAIGNDAASQGTFVDHVTFTPNSTVASSTVAFKGGVTVAGDLTITGDDLIMGTNTDTYILVADGTTYNPVAVSGDVTIANTGAVTIANNAVETAMINADAVTSAKIADDAIDSEHYTDGSIDNAHIADDAIDSEHYAAGSIDTAHIADNQVTLAKMAGLARGKIIYGDASGDPAALAVGTAGYVLATDATDLAYTNSLLAADYVIGEDAQTKIDFETANEIHFDADNAEIAKITATGLTMSGGENIFLGDASNINISTPLLANADHTTSGITAQMLAGGAISAFDLVCIHSTTSEVVKADASAYATARAIGIAPAAISDTATGTILLQGFIRDDTYNWTTGATLYLSETAGALTATAPTTDGAFVQAVGIALSPDVVYINPSMDVIEHA